MQELIEQTLKSRVKIKEFYGNKAYFRKPILNVIKEIGVVSYIAVSMSSYRIDESKFLYNKNSDE